MCGQQHAELQTDYQEVRTVGPGCWLLRETVDSRLPSVSQEATGVGNFHGSPNPAPSCLANGEELWESSANPSRGEEAGAGAGAAQRRGASCSPPALAPPLLPRASHEARTHHQAVLSLWLIFIRPLE